MGRITKLQNEIGHLQAVLATKNKMIADQSARITQLTTERDKAVAALDEPKTGSVEDTDRG